MLALIARRLPCSYFRAASVWTRLHSPPTTGTIRALLDPRSRPIYNNLHIQNLATTNMSSNGISVDEAKTLICELCRLFYDQGWVSGTGGGISVKAGDEIVMAPSGVQKERMQPDDMFVLDSKGDIIHTPAAKPPPNRPPKLSECSSLFMAVRGQAGHACAGGTGRATESGCQGWKGVGHGWLLLPCGPP